MDDKFKSQINSYLNDHIISHFSLILESILSEIATDNGLDVNQLKKKYISYKSIPINIPSNTTTKKVSVTKPPVDPSAPINLNKCRAKTKIGGQCTRNVKTNVMYCGLHGNADKRQDYIPINDCDKNNMNQDDFPPDIDDSNCNNIDDNISSNSNNDSSNPIPNPIDIAPICSSYIIRNQVESNTIYIINKNIITNSYMLKIPEDSNGPLDINRDKVFIANYIQNNNPNAIFKTLENGNIRLVKILDTSHQ
jgi:hypothetical protein